MPLSYQRDDRRQLITVVVTEPYTLTDVVAIVNRQAAEGTWHYAMLYDMRRADPRSSIDLVQLGRRVETIGAGRARGPVGLWMAATPKDFQYGADYVTSVRAHTAAEVLLTDLQVQDWLARSTKRL